MKLVLERLTSDSDSTIGQIRADEKFACFTLEDEFRAAKVMHETRIPAGTYGLKLRAEGGFHEKYKAKYGADWHKGMLHLQSVPGFEYVLIHTGNSDDDSSGCLLVGMTANVNEKGGGTVSGSNVAYASLYPKVRDALLRGEACTITIVDRDR